MLLPLLPIFSTQPGSAKNAFSGTTAGNIVAPLTDAELTNQLQTFYQQEVTRNILFSPPPKSDAPFDIIFLQLCSISWDDLDFAKEQDNPLFKRFNIIFTNFNSAASYSGPAVIRLLRGSCGQSKHSSLYDPPNTPCLTFNDLQQIGFEPQLAMNHDGQYGGFLDDVRKRGGMQAPQLDVTGAPPYLQSFDGSPVHDDYSVLSKWWNKRLHLPATRVALFYNSISLHDGNRYSGNRSASSLEIYHARLSRLLGDLDHFFNDLQASGRRAVVIFIPEHGAAVRGDKMQIAGMREIPSPHITLVPVGIKLIGMADNPATPTLVDSKSVSYLAISQLLSNFISITPFGKNSLSLEEYVRDLPTTEFVAENEDVVVMRHDRQYYIRAKNAGWVEYNPSE